MKLWMIGLVLVAVHFALAEIVYHWTPRRPQHYRLRSLLVLGNLAVFGWGLVVFVVGLFLL